MAIFRACGALAAILVVAATARVARAQGAGLVVPPKPDDAPPPAPLPPKIEAPRVEKDEGAVYPAGALKTRGREAVKVVLILDLDATGAVTRANVEAAAGDGFDEAALEAGKKLVFTPAKRDGKPIPARIKHVYTFPAQPGRIVGAIASATRGTSLAGVPVKIEGPGGAREVLTAADGTFAQDLPAGTYKIVVEAKGFVPYSSQKEVSPGERLELTLNLDPVVLVGAPPPPGVITGPVEEVVVRGVRPPREVTKRTFEQRELSRIPGTNGDALRAIQNFPGVARPPGLAGLLIVRGSAPNETNIFVDGTLVPLVYHFGGLSSVVPTEMLEKIDFYPGNFSSQYGRVVGGIVDVGLRNPKDKLHGLAQVDFIDARALVEGPVFSTGWKFAVAGRRSYVDLWLKPVLEAAGAGVTTAPVYYDYQAVLQRDIGKNQSVRFAFFGSDDRLEILVKGVNASNPGLGGNLSFGTAFYRFQGRYTNKFSDDTELRMVAAGGKDALAFQLGDNYFTLNSTPISLRTEVSQKLGQGVKTNLGMDWLWTPYEISLRLPPLPRPGEPPGAPFGGRPPLQLTETGSTYVPALYDELEITPWRGGRFVTGARIDYTKATEKWDVSPRFVARQDVTSAPQRRTTLKGGVGVFQQPPQPGDTAKIFGIPGLSSNRAIHYSLGVERELTKQIEVSLEGFYRDLDNLVVPRVGNVGTGHAMGLETLLRYKPDARFFGFLAYTLSRSTRKDGPNEEERTFAFDQTHILTALGSYRLGDGWEFGARYRLISGSLRTPQVYGFYDLNVGAYLPLQGYPPNSERNPLFHQLDVRLDKTWYLKNGAKLGFYVDILNVYNQGNSEGVTYNYNSTLSQQTNSLPILPSLGLRGEL